MRRFALYANILLAACILTTVRNGYSKPLPQNSRHSIIIDTDCAVDDFRAISYLLSIPEVSINAIIITDGSVCPENGLLKVKALLHQFNREDIPIIIGKSNNSGSIPAWREFNNAIAWGTAIGNDSVYEIVQLQNLMLNNIEEKFTIVALGPLTSVAEIIKNNETALNKIERIIWYNESVFPNKGFNYTYDQTSADFLLNSGLKVEVISVLTNQRAVFDISYFQVAKSSNTVLGSAFNHFFNQPLVYEKLVQNHFKLCDDLAAIYLLEPGLFDVMPVSTNVNIRINNGYDLEAVKEVLGDLITGKYHAGKSIVFTGFPLDREYYTYDVRQVMDSIIMLHGHDEWKSVVMTDEFHGHLGVYSIVGAKMGIRAREYFGAGQDQLEVISYAGSNPPYSCLNDGIQVSTGATLGMGTIHLVSDTVHAAKAIFNYGNHSIMLTLKPEYKQMIDADINQGLVQYGLLDNGYWKLIRKNAIKYWLEWDRDEIFMIETLK